MDSSYLGLFSTFRLRKWVFRFRVCLAEGKMGFSSSSKHESSPGRLALRLGEGAHHAGWLAQVNPGAKIGCGTGLPRRAKLRLSEPKGPDAELLGD